MSHRALWGRWHPQTAFGSSPLDSFHFLVLTGGFKHRAKYALLSHVQGWPQTEMWKMDRIWDIWASVKILTSTFTWFIFYFLSATKSHCVHVWMNEWLNACVPSNWAEGVPSKWTGIQNSLCMRMLRPALLCFSPAKFRLVSAPPEQTFLPANLRPPGKSSHAD